MIIDETQDYDQWSPSLRGLMKQIALRMSDKPDEWLQRVGVSPRSKMTDFDLTDTDIEDIRAFYDIWPDTETIWEWADEIAGRI